MFHQIGIFQSVLATDILKTTVDVKSIFICNGNCYGSDKQGNEDLY